MNATHVFKRIKENYDLSRAHITCANRRKKLIELRQFMCNFLREETPMSLKEIGRTLCRDHATIINSIRKFNDRMETEEDYANRYADFVYYMKRSKSDTKHDKAWKAICDEIGCEPKTTFDSVKDNVIMPLALYVIICQKCGYCEPKYRKPSKKPSVCQGCGYNNGLYKLVKQ